MPERPRWHRRGLLAVATAALALATAVSGPTADAGVAAPAIPPPAAGAAPASGQLRIMPLGSSSTVGTGSLATAGFRGPLETLLAADHIAYDMVGSQRSGPSSLPDRDHEGHAGWTMRRMQPFVAGWVARQHPDVVLLQVGTNDLLAGVSAAVTAQRLDVVLTTISASAPHAYVIVAGVWAPLPRHAQARARYSRLAPGVVSRHRALGQVTTYLDTSSLLSSGELFDGLHPNAVGYRKIAGIWERAIRSYLFARQLTRAPALSAMAVTAGYRPSFPASGEGTPARAVSDASLDKPVAPATGRYRPSAPQRPPHATVRASTARPRCHRTAHHGTAVAPRRPLGSSG